MATAGNFGQIVRERRQHDPFMDRRTGEDRRKVYFLEYFQAGHPDRRKGTERRTTWERRIDCVRISNWSSVCPNYEDDDYLDGKVHLHSSARRRQNSDK